MNNGQTLKTEGSREDTGGGYETLAKAGETGGQSLSVLVSGVHCAGCIQKIESALLKTPSVDAARLNFSTGRLEIGWHGKPDLANDHVKTVEALGYGVKPYNPGADAESGEAESRFLLLCLAVAGFATGNIMLFSVGLWTTDTETMGFATRELMHWLSALIAIPAVIYSGRPFFRSAYAALSKGHTNMDVPISVGVILAVVMSLWETMRGAEHAYFDSAVMLLFFLLIGRYFDSRARRSARSAATDLLQTLSGFANVLEKGKTRRVLIRDLREGMVVSVAAGEKIPVDGDVMEGLSSLDTSLVTGETMPRPVKKGDAVYAGTMNLSAPLTLKVSKAAEDSLLSDIVRLMEQAGQGQALYVRVADKAAALYTPVVHILALAAFIFWWVFFGMGWQEALMISITVLIITCPCALGLAVPVVQVLASGRLMKEGILVKSGDALERLAGIDTVLLDKTGTLTRGKPALMGDYTPEDLKLGASLARHSRHPLSQALAEGYAGEAYEIADISEHPGKGLEGTLAGVPVKLGSRRWCGVKGMASHNDLEICLSKDRAEPVFFRFSDPLKTDAKETLKRLRTGGLTTILLSGDRQSVADTVAQDCGIGQAKGDMSPVEKFEFMKALKAEGHKVLMVGDGLNDAPVLAGADVSMAPGTAIDMAQNAADIVFMGERLQPVETARRLAVFSQKLVVENFAIAILYNVIAIPLAFMGMVTPMIASLAMSGSSLLVIANSFRLKGR
jgi:Cu2+-exporting ATPase